MEDKKREVMKSALFATAVAAVALNAKTTTVHAEGEQTPAPTGTPGSETAAPAAGDTQNGQSASPEASASASPTPTDGQNTVLQEPSKVNGISSDTVTSPAPSADSGTGADTATTAVSHEVFENGYWKYVKADGTYATGITDIGYKTVYYNDQGQMQFGEQFINGHWYHFDEKTGAMSVGITDLGYKKVLYGTDGQMLYGRQNVNGKTYYFREGNGTQLFGEQYIGGHWYHFNEQTGEMSVGITDLGYKKVLYSTDGQMLFGFQPVNGRTYYFREGNGTELFGEQYINGHWYHFDEKTGEMSTGITDLGYKKVLYDNNGQMLFGENTYNGQTYYTLPGNGRIESGWRYVPSAKKTIYTDAEGKILHGYQKIGNTEYYFDDTTGAAYTGWKNVNGVQMFFYGTTGRLLRDSEQFVNGNWMYVRADGSYATGITDLGYKKVLYGTDGNMLFGFQNVNGKTYYFKPGNGTELFGEQFIDGHWYHFDKNTGEMSTGITNIGYKTVAYGTDGKMLFGLQNVNGKNYYFKPGNGTELFGEQFINGNWYHFDEKTGEMSTGITNIGYKTVLYGADGKMLFGLQNADGRTYYFKPGNGTELFGEQYINGHWYHFDEKTGEMSTGITNIGYKEVYYDGNGEMLFGKQEITGSDGQKHIIYLNEGNGTLLRGDWLQTKSGETYYADANAYLARGEQKIGDGTYYFDPSTCAVQFGWVASQNATYTKEGQKLAALTGKQTIDGNTYYFDETTHTPVTGFHTGSDNHVYYMDSNGHMQFGEKYLTSPVDGQNYWFYFDPSTGAMSTGITNLGYKTVYYDPNGRMQFGEQRINGDWHYFRPGNGTMATGLTNIGYKTVYYDNNGAMVFHNVIYNGKYYQINPNNGAVVGQSTIAYGIDISEHNGDINLNPYRNGFVMIRAGWSNTEDKQFENNIRKCEQLGISYGIYWYGYALNRDQAAAEARSAVSVLQKVNAHPTLGVWYDMEDADTWKQRNGMEFSQNNITSQVNTFCTTLNNAGYKAGVYASESWFNNGWISVSYPKWVANWGDNDGSLHDGERIANIPNTYIHQYTSSGGKLDKDVIYNTSLFA